jgi:hypothetical protein
VEQFPAISENAFEPEALNRACKAALEAPGAVDGVAADAMPNYVWDCMVRHLGFFGAISFLGVAVTVVTLFAMALAYSFSPIGSAYWATLSIFIAVMSLNSQYYAWAIGRCVTNPSA